MSSISLVISPQSVEYVGGRLDPDTDSRLNAYRLVHEQQGRAGDVRWFFFAKADLSKPDIIRDTMAFMFETRAVIRPARQALDADHRQTDYQAVWQGLQHRFTPPR